MEPPTSTTPLPLFAGKTVFFDFGYSVGREMALAFLDDKDGTKQMTLEQGLTRMDTVEVDFQSEMLPGLQDPSCDSTVRGRKRKAAKTVNQAPQKLMKQDILAISLADSNIKGNSIEQSQPLASAYLQDEGDMPMEKTGRHLQQPLVGLSAEQTPVKFHLTILAPNIVKEQGETGKPIELSKPVEQSHLTAPATPRALPGHNNSGNTEAVAPGPNPGSYHMPVLAPLNGQDEIGGLLVKESAKAEQSQPMAAAPNSSALPETSYKGAHNTNTSSVPRDMPILVGDGAQFEEEDM